MSVNKPKQDNTNLSNDRSEMIRALEKKWLEKNGLRQDSTPAKPVADANDKQNDDSVPE